MDRRDAMTSTSSAGAAPDPTGLVWPATAAPAPTAAPEVYPAPFDDAVAIQVERVETLLGAVRDIVSSLGATSAQLEREVAQALRPPQGGPGPGGAGPGAAGQGAAGQGAAGQGAAGQGAVEQPVEAHSSGSAAADVAASAAALEAERAALLEAVEHRAVIEQAKGMLMLKHRCDADTAFGLLLEISRRERRKVRDIAADVVRAGTAPRPMVDLTGQGHRTAVASSGAGEMDARRSP